MAQNNVTEPTEDPRLVEMLSQLRSTPRRDEQAARKGRVRFLSEMNALSDLATSRSPVGITAWFSRKTSKSKEIMVNTPTKLAFSSILIIVALLVFLFGGAGATAFAARSALPGDALYPVKTGLEHTRVVLAADAYTRAQLNLRFAELRLEELDELNKEGRFAGFEKLASEFESHVQEALQAAQQVAKANPELGAKLNQQITQNLLRYAQILKSTWVAVPPDARPPLERMILTSESGSGSVDDENENEVEFTGVVEAMGASAWTVSGKVINISGDTEIKGSIEVGDSVKIHALKAADGTFTAREIELDVQDGIVDNDNDDVDDNDNDDAEDNDNDDAEDNDNDDVEDNDNDDVEDNDNDNGNGNDDDNGNGNDDGNDNDNGNDDGNDNDIGNDNDNGNDDDDGNGNDHGNDNGDDGGNDNGGNDNGGDD